MTSISKILNNKITQFQFGPTNITLSFVAFMIKL